MDEKWDHAWQTFVSAQGLKQTTNPKVVSRMFFMSGYCMGLEKRKETDTDDHVVIPKVAAQQLRSIYGILGDVSTEKTRARIPLAADALRRWLQEHMPRERVE